MLGDIPLLGKLFRSKADTTITRNLVIFLTAKTLDPDGSTYRDVVDPRVLNEMNIVPSDLPGYEVPEKDIQVLQEMEELRTESRHEEEIGSIQDEIDSIKKSKKEDSDNPEEPKVVQEMEELYVESEPEEEIEPIQEGIDSIEEPKSNDSDESEENE